MLPFLKKRDEGGSTGPIEKLERKPDDDSSGYGTLDAIADDILAAIEKKDSAHLKGALSALCDHIQSLDEKQDEQTMGQS